MKKITLDDYQVRQVLQSIAANVIEWEERAKNAEIHHTARSIQKDLLETAISIEKQTNIKTYQAVSISTVFANILVYEKIEL